jgi:hypothetical protein
MITTFTTIADLPPGSVVTFDRARARHRPGMTPGLYHAELWTTEGAHYAAAVQADQPPTLHDLIAHADAEPAAWFLRVAPKGFSNPA